jgi:hypothetical protein
MITHFTIQQEKTLAGFLRRGLNSSRSCCYFLQQPVLQHSLPLQHPCFGGVAAVKVLTKARTLRINRRCFINSSFDFRMEFGHANFARRTVAVKTASFAAAEQAGVEIACLRERCWRMQKQFRSTRRGNCRSDGNIRQSRAPGPNNKLNSRSASSESVGNCDTDRNSLPDRSSSFSWAKRFLRSQSAPPERLKRRLRELAKA